MIIQIDTEILESKQVSLEEILMLLFLKQECHNAQLIDDLLKKELIKKAPIVEIVKKGVKYKISDNGISVIDSCIVLSDKPKSIEVEKERISNLATELKNIFPKGKKEGTNAYWCEGKALTMKRLKTFFIKYGNNYTDEEILNAAKSYVESFNGNYRFMRLLKYFIYKEAKGSDGKIDSSSDLLTILENGGDVSMLDNDWTSTLV